ncbi:MAG: prolipoprotein diacylglyceryl transferase [Candidatus Krumholzibacteria bacterium]|nr:prolipoprotein diacylglyceryl transferase [Candidatus Krumholzibacteria bacterium]
MEARKPGMWSRLKTKWGVSGWGAFAILLAFALAGSTVLKISRPIMGWLLPPDHSRWQWWTLRILVIVPLYEVLLLAYGVLLGQGGFFWSKQKKLGRLLARPFASRP